jgi:hypothetical protein
MTAVAHVCGPHGQAIHFIDTKTVIPRLKYGYKLHSTGGFKITDPWTIEVHRDTC